MQAVRCLAKYIRRSAAGNQPESEVREMPGSFSGSSVARLASGSVRVWLREALGFWGLLRQLIDGKTERIGEPLPRFGAWVGGTSEVAVNRAGIDPSFRGPFCPAPSTLHQQ